jgi:hypothetical protein
MAVATAAAVKTGTTSGSPVAFSEFDGSGFTETTSATMPGNVGRRKITKVSSACNVTTC